MLHYVVRVHLRVLIAAVLYLVFHRRSPEGSERGGFTSTGDFPEYGVGHILENRRSHILAIADSGCRDAKGRSHNTVRRVEFSHDAADLRKTAIGHSDLNRRRTPADTAIAFTPHQSADKHLFRATISAYADSTGSLAIVHVGGRCLQAADISLVFACLGLGETDVYVEIGCAMAGIVIGLARIRADIELSPAVPGNFNVHRAAHGIIFENTSPYASTKAREAMESRFRIGCLYADQRTGDLAVTDGGNAFVLLDDADKRGDIGALCRKDKPTVFHTQVPDFAVGHRAKQACLVTVQFCDPQATDGMSLSIKDTLEGVTPPFGRREFIVRFINANRLPVVDAGQVQVVFQHIPTV